MRLVFVRHGDPNYELDCLTSKGEREADLLSKLLKDEKIDYVYCSPLGRAKQTCEYYLKQTGKKAEVKEWLREFDCPVFHDDDALLRYPWDYQPDFWTDEEIVYDYKKWKQFPPFVEYGIDSEYDRIICEFDKLLAQHGYEREDNHYKVTNSNHDTIIFFCHFGLESVLLSRLLNISPFILWHHTCALTTSVTRVITEERKQGYGVFRMIGYGDLDHLRRANEPASKSALFTECFEDDDAH